MGVGASGAVTTITWGLLGLSARLDDIPFGGSTASQPTSFERDYGQSRGQTNNLSATSALMTSHHKSSYVLLQRSVSCASIPMSTKEPMNDTAVSDTWAFAMHLPELFGRKTCPGGNTRPDERANRPNRRGNHKTEIERPSRATSATTSTMAAIRACFHLPVKKKPVSFEITPAGTPIATVDMSM